MHFKPIEDTSERRRNLINELLILLIIYFLIMFTGAYIQEPELIEQIGTVLVGVTIAIFVYTFTPIISDTFKQLKHWYIRRSKTKELQRVEKSRKERKSREQQARLEVE